MSEWPFDQPRNCAVITVQSILNGLEPVLHVTHDEEDHGWQFLTLRTPKTSDAAVVGLGEMIDRDPSLLELADLPPGWHAYRSDVRSPWTRAPQDW